MSWRLTERTGPRVRRRSFDDLGPALDALETRGRELADTAPNEAVDLRYKRFEPGQRVIARLELSGPERLVPSVRAGVDIHGDGSVKAYQGRVRRQIVEPRRRESAYAALRREIGGRSSS